MKFIPVNSSDLSGVCYENGVLYIQFGTGAVYSYENIPQSLYEGLMSAPSHGIFFHAEIRSKPHLYPYKKIR